MTEFIDNLNLILLNVGYSELYANWNWKEVYSPFARFYFVKEGRARTYLNDQVYSLEPGDLCLTPPFTLHNDECDSTFSLYYIHFYEKLVNKESLFDKYEFPFKIKATESDSILIERLHSINPGRQLTNIDPRIYDNDPTFSQSVIQSKKMPLHTIIETQSILSILMSRFLEQRNQKKDDKNERIHKSLKYIHTNINRPISLKTLADISCVTEDHYIRIFKKEMGLTPLKYINAKKIENAQLLLLTTDLPIRDIALELAFDNVSYFNRIFKQATNKTPLEYRRGIENSNAATMNR